MTTPIGSIALYQPEIAQNVGTIIRLAQCFDMSIDLIHPLGFIFSDAQLKRAGMDYVARAKIEHHQDFHDFTQKKKDRIVLFDTSGKTSLYDFRFRKTDILLFGKESTGVPQSIMDACQEVVRIPINDRSLNLAVSAGIGAASYRRQFRLES
ncbi:MAG: tRNA (cytidine(34)-2'-O)-methyltransferase [Alphaproteobacteria bacterium]|nr:MAG: tRNA (cytidine(34)-2'-O)-methyltransferase [Alphaproteobacteria bacterium]